MTLLTLKDVLRDAREEKKKQSGLCDLGSLSGWKLALLKTASAFFKWNIYTSIKITCTLSSCAQTAANLNGPNSVCEHGTKLRRQSQTPCSYMHEGMAQNSNNKQKPHNIYAPLFHWFGLDSVLPLNYYVTVQHQWIYHRHEVQCAAHTSFTVKQHSNEWRRQKHLYLWKTPCITSTCAQLTCTQTHKQQTHLTQHTHTSTKWLAECYEVKSKFIEIIKDAKRPTNTTHNSAVRSVLTPLLADSAEITQVNVSIGIVS